MTIRECMLFIQNKKESITDEKELDFLDSAFTYLVDYYDHSKESKRNNNRYDMIKETQKKIENNSIDKKDIEEIKECIYKNR